MFIICQKPLLSLFSISLFLLILSAFIVYSPAALAEEKDSEMQDLEQKESKSHISNSAIDIIMRRKSVRAYTEQDIPKETLYLLVKAGMAAPTARNRQPWAFVIITDREILDALGDMLPSGRMLKKAPAAISVVGLPEEGSPGEINEFWVQDCSAATQNILLAVESLDLGAVWIGIHPNNERVNSVKKLLNLPQDVIPLNIISIGHPTGAEQPKDKYKPEKIHWNLWK